MKLSFLYRLLICFNLFLKSFAREIDRKPTAPVGFVGHIHRIDQEPAVQILESSVCALRARDRKVSLNSNNK
jgi:hypothetical protein